MAKAFRFCPVIFYILKQLNLFIINRLCSGPLMN